MKDRTEALKDWVWPSQPAPRYFEESTNDIVRRLRDAAKGANVQAPVDQLLASAEAHFAEPEERADSAQRRATAILGTVPVAATIAVAGGTVLLDRTKIASDDWRAIIAGALVLLALCLAVACYRALLATSKPFFWSTPAPNDVFAHAVMSENDVKLHRAADMFKAYGINDAVADVKVALVAEAGKLLAAALALLVVFAGALAGYATFGPEPPSPEPSPVWATDPFAVAAQRVLDARGTTIRRAAARSGIPLPELHRALQPDSTVPLHLAVKFAAAFGLKPDFFAEVRLARAHEAIRDDDAFRDEVYQLHQDR